MPNHRYTIDFIKKTFEKEGYEVVFTPQKGAKGGYNTPIDVLCPAKHDWAIEFWRFLKGTRCNRCHQNAKLTLDYIKQEMAEYDYVVLSTSYINCKTPLFIRCPQKHKIKMCWNSFQQGERCRQCYEEKNFYTIDMIREIVEARGYILLSKTYEGYDVPLKMICPRNHLRVASFCSIQQDHECAQCAWEDKRQDLQYVKNYLAQYGYAYLSKSYEGTKCKIDTACPKGHAHTTCWNDFQQGHRCVQCFGSHSRAEQQMAEYLKKYTSLIEGSKTIIKPYELDIYFPDKKVAIEYCGLYWHSTAAPGDRITPQYHRNKLDLCNKQNIRLLTVFEDEWLNHEDICISRINNVIGMVKDKIFARKCEVRQISNKEAYIFLARTHLQGPGRCRIAYGLFYNDKLVQVMTFGFPNRAHTSKGKKVLEMKRLAGELNTIIVGGASKLFKLGLQYARNNGYEIIKSYCDLRWGTGNLYQKLGFAKTSESKYTRAYTDGYKRWRNQSLATNRQKEGITEKEKAVKQRKWDIYDCGHQTWEYKI